MRHSFSRTARKAFTLVELAIVLVIIGLIITVVLSGQEMIRAAQNRSIISQYQTFMTGVLAFQQKYNNRLPGDVNGTTFGLTGSSNGSTGSGDQNGFLSHAGSTASTVMNGEIVDFWSHLTTPGKEFIPGNFRGNQTAVASSITSLVNYYIPGFRFGGSTAGWGVAGDSATYKNYFLVGVQAAGLIASQALVSTTSLQPMDIHVPMDAYNMDLKIDDGVPNAGLVQVGTAGVSGFSTTASSASGASTTTCVDVSPTPDTYQYTATIGTCALRFEMTNY